MGSRVRTPDQKHGIVKGTLGGDITIFTEGWLRGVPWEETVKGGCGVSAADFLGTRVNNSGRKACPNNQATSKRSGPGGGE